MRYSQKERLALRQGMTGEDVNRALWFRLGGGSSPLLNWFGAALQFPLLVVDTLWWALYIAMYFLAPLDTWTLVTGTHGGGFAASASQYFVIFVHSVFAIGFAGYAVEVFIHVPWGRKLPLVVAPYVYPIRWTGLHFIALGGIAVLKALPGNLQAYTIIAEGVCLLYFYMIQPAFGFIKWTDADEKKFNNSNMSTSVATNKANSVEKGDETYAVPFVAQKSGTTFASIFGMRAVKDKLIGPAKLILAPRAVDSEAPRNGILMSGEPGNGKTVFARALAGELGVPIIEVTYGEMSSQWVGNMPRVLANTFAYAKRNAPCVLFLDEIDSFIKSRDSAGGSSEDLKITNTLLTEIVNLRGHKVILMAATNYLANLDAAAIREGRFDYKVEITPPDEDARIGIITSSIRKYAAGLDVVEVDALSVAKRWNGFSVARLVTVTKALPDLANKTGDSHIGLAQWMTALREVQGRQGKLPGDTKSLSELILDSETRTTIDLVASRLKDISRVESMGGTLPTGVLFHGPSGTGKTAAARAMAKEAGWAFLSVAGPDLLADRTKLDKLFAEAKDIRPTIVFIDEADDILRNRQYSNSPDMVNKLLTVMDGADDKVKDVVWIAATNHPDQIDPALLRSGRFTEKVMFGTPPRDQIPRHISNWLKKRGVGLDTELDVFDIAECLAGQTIADVEGVLQYSLNSAITHTATGSKPSIQRSDLAQALRVVLNTNIESENSHVRSTAQ